MYYAIRKNLDLTIDEAFFWRKSSFLARLGSGSACRSLSGELVVYVRHEAIPESSNIYGVVFTKDIHPVFKTYRDCNLLLDKG